MRIQNIQFNHFKGYRKAQFNLDEGFNLFYGENGVGKTNVLDGIWFGLHGKSYFSLTEAQLIHQQETFARVAIQGEVKEEHFEINIGWYRGKRKQITLNGEKVKSARDLVGRFPVVMIVPGDIELVYGHSDVRRKYMDQTASNLNSQYLNHLIQYRKILDQRNKYLKGDGEVDHQLLMVLSEQMVPHADFLQKHRIELAEQIIDHANRIYKQLAGSDESIVLDWESDVDPGQLVEAHRETLQRDQILRRTTKGPHRDELQLTLNSVPLKKIASQGQIKTVLIALKLAQANLYQEVGNKLPVVVLDDIFEKLDSNRSAALFEWLDASPVEQILITDTEKERGKIALRKCGKRQKMIHIRRDE